MTRGNVGGSAVPADVCLVLEGTYPYVKGGVSTWVHNLIGGLPEIRFGVVHIGPEQGTYRRRHYSPPSNVVAFTDLYCREHVARGSDPASLHRAARTERRRHAEGPRSSRVLRGIRRLHLAERVDASLLDDLAGGDLTAGGFLHGPASFDLTVELYERLAPYASFLDFFWHFRSMHLPLVRLLGAEPPVANVYHSLCTGYAGLLAAVWSRRSGRPFLLTEHGIYARERKLELDRAAWLHGPPDGWDPNNSAGGFDSPTASALHRMWAHFFGTLATCAYGQASAVVSLCEASRNKQVADGATAEKTLVVPNGIDVEGLQARIREAPPRTEDRAVRVGFVGRLVPIKDVVTLIRACALASQAAEIEVRIVGPMDEDPRYARRCQQLAAKLGLLRSVRFEASLPIERVYPEIDILVLTSLSEGQPLVILEAGAAGIPVVASDVGACRELLEGRHEEDRSLGPGGIVTRLAAPDETAAAIVRLAGDEELRRRMGEAGRQRVARYYQERETVSAYRTLYTRAQWQESVGALSA